MPRRDTTAPGPSGRTGRLRLVVGLLIGAGAIYAVVSSGGGFGDAVGALASARPALLVAGGLAEAASYATLGLLLRRLVGARECASAWSLPDWATCCPPPPPRVWPWPPSSCAAGGVDTHRTRIALGLMQWLSIRTLFRVAALDALAVTAVATVRYPQQAPGRFVLGAIALAVLLMLAATAWLATRCQTMELLALGAGRIRFWQPRHRHPNAERTAPPGTPRSSKYSGRSGPKRRSAASP